MSPKSRQRTSTQEFLGHAAAADIVETLNNLISRIQISGRAERKLKSAGKTPEASGDINMGLCGLYKLHDAFRDGCKSTGWEVEHRLSGLYWLFGDGPAPHEDFVKATGCDITMLREASFPIKG